MSVGIPLLERISTEVRREHRLRHAVRAHHHLAETLNVAEQSGLQRHLASERRAIGRHLANKGSNSLDGRPRCSLRSVVTPMSMVGDSRTSKNSGGSELDDDYGSSEPEVDDVKCGSLRSDDRNAHEDGHKSDSDVNKRNVVLEKDSIQVENDVNEILVKSSIEKNEIKCDDEGKRCRFEFDLVPMYTANVSAPHSSRVHPGPCRYFPCASSECCVHPVGFGLPVPDRRPQSPLSFTTATNTSRFAVTFRRSVMLSEVLAGDIPQLAHCLEPTTKLPFLDRVQLPLNVHDDDVLFKSARRSVRPVAEQRTRLTTIREMRLERLVAEVSKYNSPEWINTAYGTRISDIRRRQGKKLVSLKHCL